MNDVRTMGVASPEDIELRVGARDSIVGNTEGSEVRTADTDRTADELTAADDGTADELTAAGDRTADGLTVTQVSTTREGGSFQSRFVADAELKKNTATNAAGNKRPRSRAQCLLSFCCGGCGLCGRWGSGERQWYGCPMCGGSFPRESLAVEHTAKCRGRYKNTASASLTSILRSFSAAVAPSAGSDPSSPKNKPGREKKAQISTIAEMSWTQNTFAAIRAKLADQNSNTKRASQTSI